ncbi:MAG: hypothetical protein ACYC0V_21365, partial [Armatimonadota bacterium]
MRTLENLWQTCEILPGPAAVSAGWRRFIGEEYDLVKALLIPQAQPAEVYPSERGCYHQVVHHESGDIVAVGTDDCEGIKLSKQDLIV